MGDTAISIELTRSQIGQIVREAGEDDHVHKLVQGLGRRNDIATRYLELAESPRLSRSLLLGLLVLACFPADGSSLAVSDVAERLSMSPSTTHRYMTTLLAVGLLEQDPRSRRYRIPVAA